MDVMSTLVTPRKPHILYIPLHMILLDEQETTAPFSIYWSSFGRYPWDCSMHIGSKWTLYIKQARIKSICYLAVYFPHASDEQARRRMYLPHLAYEPNKPTRMIPSLREQCLAKLLGQWTLLTTREYDTARATIISMFGLAETLDLVDIPVDARYTELKRKREEIDATRSVLPRRPYHTDVTGRRQSLRLKK